MHAITIAEDQHRRWIYEHFEFSELFQNFEIFIGNDSDFTQNARCPGGPFQRLDDTDSYVYDDFLGNYGDDLFG